MHPRLFRPTVAKLLTSMAFATVAYAAEPGPKVGDAAPAVQLKTVADTSVALADLVKQSPVVVLFLRGYPGYQCPLCTKQVGSFVAAADKIKAAGARVLLIYPGPGDQLQMHAKEFETGKSMPEFFQLVIDPDFVATEAWHLRWKAENETAYPSTYVVDQHGVIRYAKTSTTHGGRASIEDVLAALKQIKS